MPSNTEVHEKGFVLTAQNRTRSSTHARPGAPGAKKVTLCTGKLAGVITADDIISILRQK